MHKLTIVEVEIAGVRALQWEVLECGSPLLAYSNWRPSARNWTPNWQDVTCEHCLAMRPDEDDRVAHLTKAYGIVTRGGHPIITT